MDQLPSVIPETPTAYVPTTYQNKLFLIIVFMMTTILSFLAGYFFSKFSSPKNQPPTISTKPNSSIPAVLPNLTVSLPIPTTSSSVKSLYIVYLLNGVVDNITPITKSGKSGYEIQISSPTGPLVNQKFFVNDQTTNIVRLDKQGKETKYQLSAIQKGDSIQLNYQLDIKKQSEAQITKITVLK